MGIKRIDYERCNKCNLCYMVCPMDVFGKFGNTVYLKYPDDCMVCFQCVLVCKQEACIVDHTRAKPIPAPNF